MDKLGFDGLGGKSVNVKSLMARIAALEAENEKLRDVFNAASGLSHGVDWNNGTHAKIYRSSLIAAIDAARKGE